MCSHRVQLCALPTLPAVLTILGSRSQCAAGAAGVPQNVPTSGTSTWDFSLAFGEGGHRPAAALVSSSAVRQAVPRAWLVDPPLEPRWNQRDHDRYQVDAALVADHVHILALVDEA